MFPAIRHEIGHMRVWSPSLILGHLFQSIGQVRFKWLGNPIEAVYYYKKLYLHFGHLPPGEQWSWNQVKYTLIGKLKKAGMYFLVISLISI